MKRQRVTKGAVLTKPRYNSGVLRTPGDVLDAWAERQKMIRSVLRAGASMLAERAIKHVLKREREVFLQNARDGRRQRPLNLQELLSVFTA